MIEACEDVHGSSRSSDLFTITQSRYLLIGNVSLLSAPSRLKSSDAQIIARTPNSAGSPQIGGSLETESSVLRSGHLAGSGRPTDRAGKTVRRKIWIDDLRGPDESCINTVGRRLMRSDFCHGEVDLASGALASISEEVWKRH